MTTSANRFLAEARIMRRIHDRRLVQVYDIGTLPDGRPYFVMDHIDGGSMNDLRTAGVEPIRALRLSAEACRALEVLHEHDIIHRDVTPGNLLLSHDPNGETRVLVADLGVAKSMIDAVGATMTAGTPSYMAPEQAGGRVQLDRRADIYSLTAVTYALLTGKPPFAGQEHRRHPGPRPGGGTGADRGPARRSRQPRRRDDRGPGQRSQPPTADRAGAGRRPGDHRPADGIVVPRPAARPVRRPRAPSRPR